MELAALEQQLEMIQKNTDKKLVRFNFFNLFLMSVQFGMFARLTWYANVYVEFFDFGI